MKNTINFSVLFAFLAILSLVVVSSAQAQTTNSPKKTASGTDQPAEKWIQLFNGKDLTGWTAKIRGHELGDNYADTFRVENGVLFNSYDKYVDADFKSMDGKRDSWEKFGHLFYKDAYSNYILRVEYRFVGDQAKNGPGWAFRNNGLMLHGQDPATMTKNQRSKSNCSGVSKTRNDQR